MKTGANGKFWIWGRHAVEAVLKFQKRKIHSLLLSTQILEEFSQDGVLGFCSIKPEVAEMAKFNHLFGRDVNHQGCAVLVSTMTTLDLKAFLSCVKKRQRSLVIALDQLTDPHNIGAIMRSSLAFGVDGIIAVRDNAAFDGPTVARASAGALEQIDIMRVTNLVSALKSFKEEGYWVVGLDTGSQNADINTLGQYYKVVVVLGAEGQGLRALTQKSCDILMRIPISGQMESLNVSNAAAIAMFCYANSSRQEGS
jgi:23S rRNA (guanosine2251-2'-O)-methyltransferase